MHKFWYFLFSLTLCGCTLLGTPAATLTAQPILPTTAVPTATATSAPTATATAVPLITQIASPLQGIPLSDLAGITSNPFKLKYPFSEGPSGDENHPAVDLGFYHFGTLNTDDGLPIQAILPGKVVEALDDRYPYGNMVLIETPLEALAPELITQMQIPQPYSEQDLKIHSTCQPDQTRIPWSQTGSSVYSLYAHMKNPPTLKVGDQVQAGDLIGGIGYSGHSAESIEHLHLEVRVGPADAKFGVISDYLSTSTEEERYNYCIWALSEVFLPINPSLFWAQTSNQGQ